MTSVLIDAGPLVALLSKRDKDHARCVDVLKSLHEPLMTTWMAVTEAIYLLSFSIRAQIALLEMIERESILVASPEVSDLPDIRNLLRQYADLPMDFADATLVSLANKRGTNTIFTLDRRNFSVYRLARGKAFNIVPIEN